MHSSHVGEPKKVRNSFSGAGWAAEIEKSDSRRRAFSLSKFIEFPGTIPLSAGEANI